MVEGLLLACWGVLGYGGAKLVYPAVERLLRRIGSIQDNYRGRKIPVGAGLAVYLCGLAAGVLQWWFYPDEYVRHVLPWLLLGAGTATLAGWMDDQHGDPQVKGLRGHFGVFFRQGVLTTGMLKAAILTAAAAIIGGVFSRNFWHWCLLTGTLVLSVNTFNLLDVRPGRSVKAFFFVFTMAAFFSPGFGAAAWMPYVGAVLAVSRFELQERCMLGDTGSNLLGMLFGLWLLAQQQLEQASAFFVLFVGLHVLAETSSISRAIERIRWLKRVDEWGRTH